jgi:hypothetical protein
LNLNECRKRLVRALDKLNDERHDHHPEPSPVEDIIDPDLLLYHPNDFDRNAWIEWRTKEWHAEEPDDEEHLFDTEFKTVEEKAAFEVDQKITDHVKLRSRYQWMPTNFVIDENGHVKISTNIPQLERTLENEQTYEDIARVFEAMLPAFQTEEILGQSAQPGNTLQVVVKAQSYNLKAGG